MAIAYQKPHTVAEEKFSVLVKFILVIFLSVVILQMMSLGVPGVMMAAIFTVGLVLFRVLYFKRCPVCLRNYITKPKRICFSCWRSNAHIDD